MPSSSASHATALSLVYRSALHGAVLASLLLIFLVLPDAAAGPRTSPPLVPAPVGTLPSSSSPASRSTPTATATQVPRAEAAVPMNFSTRVEVETNDRVAITGLVLAPIATDRLSFLSSTAGKRIFLRALGPSLVSAGIGNALPDPVLELYAADGSLITRNDNWVESANKPEIEATRAAPSNKLESAIITTLDAGTYTLVLRGKEDVTGVGLVEIYDLDPGSGPQIINMSTRGWVEPADNVMIGGFVLGPEGSLDASLLIRAIGPALAEQGVIDSLSDPVLELHDANGALIRRNDNWKLDQQSAIVATGAAPADDRESAIIASLPPGNYTVMVAGKNGQSGVVLLEIDRLPAGTVSETEPR